MRFYTDKALVLQKLSILYFYVHTVNIAYDFHVCFLIEDHM